MIDCSISIIIPAYNVEKYLKAALDSISSQDQLPDEVILIDDGSTDRTLEIAEAYCFPIPYHVVSIENGGQGNARNIGVSMSSCEYVYFFDSDDLLVKNFISSVKDQIRRNEYTDIVLFSGESFNDSEYKGNRWINYCRGFSGVFNNRTDLLKKALSHNGLFCSPCLYVSRKSLWGSDKLKFDSNFYEDEAIFYPLLFSCSNFVVINEKFFMRRNREGSTMTMVPNIKHVNGALNCIETTMRLYYKKGLSSKERSYISKQLQSHCLAYIVSARRAGFPLILREMLRVIVKARSVSLAGKAFIYGIRADQLNTVRRVYRAIKVLKSRKSSAGDAAVV